MPLYRITSLYLYKLVNYQVETKGASFGVGSIFSLYLVKQEMMVLFLFVLAVQKTNLDKARVPLE